jgi:hypothetical protein
VKGDQGPKPLFVDGQWKSAIPRFLLIEDLRAVSTKGHHRRRGTSRGPWNRNEHVDLPWLLASLRGITPLRLFTWAAHSQEAVLHRLCNVHSSPPATVVVESATVERTALRLAGNSSAETSQVSVIGAARDKVQPLAFQGLYRSFKDCWRQKSQNFVLVMQICKTLALCRAPKFQGVQSGHVLRADVCPHFRGVTACSRRLRLERGKRRKERKIHEKGDVSMVIIVS